MRGHPVGSLGLSLSRRTVARVARACPRPLRRVNRTQAPVRPVFWQPHTTVRQDILTLGLARAAIGRVSARVQTIALGGAR